jgi:ribosomal protein S6--L-glutamate ligase/gamma-F420-2:alpha-L-glutamate ligase
LIGLLYDDNQVDVSRPFIERIRAHAHHMGEHVELIVINPTIDLDLLAERLNDQFQLVLSRTRHVDLLTRLVSVKPPIVNRPALTLTALDKASIPLVAMQAKVRCLPLIRLGIDDLPNWEGSVVSKPRFGYGGKDVYRHDSFEEALIRFRQHGSQDWIIQPYAPTAHTEFRAYIVGTTLRWLVQKRAFDGFHANRSHHASVHRTEPDTDARAFVARLVSVLGEGYYGIDFYRDDDGLVLNEIEDPVGARAIYELNLGDPAGELVSYATHLRH